MSDDKIINYFDEQSQLSILIRNPQKNKPLASYKKTIELVHQIKKYTGISILNIGLYFKSKKEELSEEEQQQVISLRKLVEKEFEVVVTKNQNLVTPIRIQIMYEDVVMNYTYENIEARELILKQFSSISEKNVCICSEDTCKDLFVVRHIKTNLYFGIGSSCIYRFCPKFGNFINNSLRHEQNPTCSQCNDFLFEMNSNTYKKNYLEDYFDGKCLNCFIKKHATKKWIKNIEDPTDIDEMKQYLQHEKKCTNCHCCLYFKTTCFNDKNATQGLDKCDKCFNIQNGIITKICISCKDPFKVPKRRMWAKKCLFCWRMGW